MPRKRKTIPDPAIATPEIVSAAMAEANTDEPVATIPQPKPVNPELFERVWKAWMSKDFASCSAKCKLALVAGLDTAILWDIYSVVEWKLGRVASARAAVAEALKRDGGNQRIRSNAEKMGVKI